MISITEVRGGELVDLDGKTVLVTGATGSFGTAFIRRILEHTSVAAVRAFSRDELKQSELRRKVDDSRLRLLLGDVRDLERLRIAMRGVDLVVHAAALKQVPACEYNPFEAVQTNVHGAQNVITAAIETGVAQVVALSTDKAVNPVNLYGATKLCAERIFAQAGVYAQDWGPTFICVRYGNVVGSRGSVVPVFQEQASTGCVTITDERMTRFWITLDQAMDFVLTSLGYGEDGNVFVPKIPSARITDLAEAFAPNCERVVTGIRPGEKLHECLLTEDESRNARDLGDRFVIYAPRPHEQAHRGDELPDGFRYTSDTNDQWLTVEEISTLGHVY